MDKQEFRDYVIAFIIGSSILITLITLLYVGYAFRKAGRPSDIPYELYAIFIPIMYGVFNVANVYLQKKYKFCPNISLAVGALFGLLLSFFGRFGYDLPKRIFEFSEQTESRVHIIAPVMYALIFRFIVQPVNEYVLDSLI